MCAEAKDSNNISFTRVSKSAYKIVASHWSVELPLKQVEWALFFNLLKENEWFN
jgi:hypothetical protein